MTKLDKKTTCVEIDEMNDDLAAELGIEDITHNTPELLYQCEMNNGHTLGFFRAQDGAIFRHDLMGDEEELNQVTAEELEQYRDEYIASEK